MEFITQQQTNSSGSKRVPKFKIYNNKIYYVWYERDVNTDMQIWFATSNLDGSNFIKMQLTNYTIDSYEPELYIYNDLIYLAWYGAGEVTVKNQIWIASMQLDGSNLTVLYVTDHVNGARKSKIAIKNDIIYLAYESEYYDNGKYHFMSRAKLNIDGSNFISKFASTSANEIVYNVNLFVPEDPSDTKIYYIWTREYFITDPPAVYIYSADADLSNFTRIKVIAKKTSDELYILNNKLYFNIGNTFNKINTDGSGHEELFTIPIGRLRKFQITDDIIDFAISIGEYDFPTKLFQILAGSYNINTKEYIETELANEIRVSFNDVPNLQFVRNNDNLYYIWQQYDTSNIYQIWLGILSEDSIYNFCQWVANLGGPDNLIAYDIMQLVQGYLKIENLGFDVMAIEIMATVAYYLGDIEKGNEMSGCDF